MIEVELPDGSTVEFPADTPQAVMQSAIRAHLSSQPGQPQESAPQMSPTERQKAALRSGEPIAIPGFEPGQPPAGQDILDLLGSGGLGAAGMMAGAPAGPVGSIALGGAGAAAGKRIARDVGSLFGLKGSEEYPAAGESTLDAAAGAAGPALSVVSKPIVKFMSGVTGKMAAKVQPAHADLKMLTEGKRFLEKPLSQIDSAPGMSAAQKTELKEILESANMLSGLARDRAKAVLEEKVAQIAKKVGKQAAGAATEVPRKLGDAGALIMAIGFGDLTSAAMLFGAGVASSPARVAVAKRLLSNERAVEWILRETSQGITAPRLLTSLSGLAAIEGISPEVKRDIRTLQEGAEGEARPKPKAKTGWRESRALREDRDGLEELMSGKG